MAEAVVKIRNKVGLHARPAAMLVSKASKYKSDITLTKGSKVVNAKSIMGVLSLGACQGDEITIKAEGRDEDEALEVILDLIEHLED